MRLVFPTRWNPRPLDRTSGSANTLPLPRKKMFVLWTAMCRDADVQRCCLFDPGVWDFLVLFEFESAGTRWLDVKHFWGGFHDFGGLLL